MRGTTRKYQDEGVDWLYHTLHRYGAALLADDAGLGKTLQALKAAAALDAERILIVCPAGARRVWQLEIQRWFPQWSRRVVLLEPGSRKNGYLFNGPLILIIGYDDFSIGTPEAQMLRDTTTWQLLILDEAHYLKNLSNRTKGLYGERGIEGGMQAHADNIILLTGTPTPNHAGELYQHVRTFWPWALVGKGTQAEFEEAYTRYKDTLLGRQIVGSKNQKILREKLGPVILRRRKLDVLPELPPLQLQDVPLIPVLEDLPPLMSFDHFNDIMDELPLATLRRKLGVAKAPAVVNWVCERLDSVTKILLFAWHLEVIEQLARGLVEFQPAVIVGGTSPAARNNAIGRFQVDPRCRVFVGQIQAAGTAITLTAASEVAIVEPSWVPGENVQAIARAHRLGQRDSVLASFLFLPDTLDETVMRVFRRKASEIAELEEIV